MKRWRKEKKLPRNAPYRLFPRIEPYRFGFWRSLVFAVGNGWVYYVIAWRSWWQAALAALLTTIAFEYIGWKALKRLHALQMVSDALDRERERRR